MYEYKDPTDIKNQVSRIDEQISKLRSEIVNIAFTKPGEQKNGKKTLKIILLINFKRIIDSVLHLKKTNLKLLKNI